MIRTNSRIKREALRGSRFKKKPYSHAKAMTVYKPPVKLNSGKKVGTRSCEKLIFRKTRKKQSYRERGGYNNYLTENDDDEGEQYMKR